MAGTFVYNQVGKGALVLFLANATMNVAVVNSTVDSDFSVAGSVEANTITGGTISKLFWSTPSLIQVKRGANVVFQLNGTSFLDLRGMGVSEPLYPAATLGIVVNDANSMIYVEVVKSYAAGSGSINENDH